MYSFSICRDKDLIIKTLTSPNNAPYQFEEDEDLSQLDPVLDGQLTYIKCTRDSSFLGLVIIIEGSSIEGHFCFLPQAYGKVAKICEECLTWLWENTTYNSIRAPILENNTLARRVVDKIGFKNLGYSGKEYKKKDQMIKTLIYRIERA